MIRSSQQSAQFAPSLNLDFRSGVMPPGLTFIRNSVATRINPSGVLETVAAHTPRFDYDPVTGQLRGLLIEETRTNSCLYSEQLDQATWGKSLLTVTADATTAPSGGTSAELMVPTATVGHHYPSPGVLSFVSGNTYTMSIFVKPAGYTVVSLQTINTVFGNYLENRFSLTGNGAVLFTGAGCTNTITPYPNGWYRVSMTATATATLTSGGYFLIIRNGNNTSTYAGDGTSGMYFWGAQFEQGAFATSYIPTTSAAVTRQADVCRWTGIANLFNATDEGTLYVDFTRAA
ncbi:phage head spike fiber domain-containing protein, partial [Spirosoma humi]